VKLQQGKAKCLNAVHGLRTLDKIPNGCI